MKKKVLIELIQERYNGGQTNPDIIKKLHPAVLQEYISMALNTVFYNIFRLDPSGLDIYARWFYSEPVLNDANGYYCNLPVSKIQIPDGSSSIKRITQTEVTYPALFLPTTTTTSGRAIRTGTSRRMNVIPYEVSDVIRFIDFDHLIKKVNILSLVPFSDLGDDDEIVIPSGQDAQLMELVRNFIIGKVENDNVTNNN